MKPIRETCTPRPEVLKGDLAFKLGGEDRDYVEKKQLYEKAGVEEYWIIDPPGMNVEFYRLVDGKYELMPLEDGDMIVGK